ATVTGVETCALPISILTRPNLRVKSLELRSYLSEAGSDNSLDRSYADGKVEIQQTSPARTRTGTSEHAEYYTAEDKIILRGGSRSEERRVGKARICR